jgi:hypothetical protein
MILFGGFNLSGTYFNDVWMLSLESVPRWDQLLPSGEAPAPRALPATTYDSARSRLLVFAGIDASTLYNDTWELTLTDTVSWRQLTPAGSTPSARFALTAIYQPGQNRMVIFGGFNYESYYLNDTWALTLGETPTWSNLTPAGPLPNTRDYHTAIYDAVRDQMVIFAGYDGHYLCPLNDTWGLSLGATPTWTQLVSPLWDPPSARHGMSTIYDPVRQRLVLFGGNACSGSCYLNDVWSLTLDARPAWTPLFAGGSGGPQYRYEASAIYDPLRDRMIIFGGTSAYRCEPHFDCPYDNNDVWAFALDGTAAWTQLVPAGPPPAPRHGHAAIYDPVGDRMLVFGGEGSGSVWALSLGTTPTWSLLQPQGTAPTGRTGPSAIYDPVRQRMLIFGGSNGPVYNDTWALTLTAPPVWTPLAPSGSPPGARRYHTAGYDAIRDRLVIFGGETDYGWYNDTWALALGSPAWTPLEPAGTLPGPRSKMAAVLDPLGDRLVVFGGCGNYVNYRDTWALTWEQATAVRVALPQVDARADRVRLVWRLHDTVPPTVQVERRTPPGPWEHRATVKPAADGGVVYEDRAVTPGARYQYALGIQDGAEESRAGEVEVVVPPRALTLADVRPQPVRGPLRVTVTPRVPGSIRVELLDAAGRCVRLQHLTAAAAAAQSVVLGATRPLPAGVYLVRATQGPDVATMRVCIVH